ncbi:MAG: B12-binding domain-containing radical SAM protein [Patescibacteria group bacterium]|nr:B12-binding domain-containing radical SAM protein [Patescibacteria group bacterium]
MAEKKSKNNILLVRPFIKEYVNSQSADSFESSIGLIPPLNLVYLASALEKANIKVKIFDCEANKTEGQFISFLKKEKPAIVGISIITTNFHGALYTARLVKKILPKTPIICGGTHMMIFPKETLSYREFDFGLIGEAEEPLVQFILNFKKGAQTYPKIPGLIWKNKNKIKINKNIGFNQDLDKLPYPAYHLLDLSAYRMPNSADNIVSLFLSRGCPYHCGFCYRNPILQKVRFKSIDHALAEISYLVEKFHIKSINFVDETISLKKDYFLKFCERLAAKKLGVSWQSPTRVTAIDEEVVKAAKKAGCHTFRFGIESGSNKILKKINKGITIDQSEKAIRLCQKYGIKTVGYFIIGYLEENEETIRETINFAKKLNTDYAAFFPATPMPQTDLCHECEEKKLITKDYWKNFVLGKDKKPLPFIYPNAGEWVSRAYHEFYFSPKYIFRQARTLDFYRNFGKNLSTAKNLLVMKFKRS